MKTELIHFYGMVLQSLQGFFMLLVIFVPLELAFARRNTALLRKNFHQDLIFHFVNSLLPQLLMAVVVGVLVAVIRPVYASGFFHWVSSIPLLLRFALAVIIGDIGSYWGHRWSHEIPFLWHFHRIHHQAETIDWLVTSRAHPLDMVFVKLCGVALIYGTGLAQGSLGQGTALMSSYLLIGGLWAYFVHANINWRFGPLEKWLASPAFHHWHHSNESLESIDKNYAAIFPWIDRLFGTLHLPSRRWPASYGEKVNAENADNDSFATTPPLSTAP
jgi:sterol desaturase/sphingolipid hydroxylase (fatty acid hydroxylase superfamily)